MCGVVAIHAGNGEAVSSELLQRMTALIAHRGPDDCGFVQADPCTGKAHGWSESGPAQQLHGVLLGHRRLSILDLTAGGHQPMLNDDATMAVSYNGEIYNYLELRRELEGRGAVFRSRSDTEVLLKAYEYWGETAFSRFNGMWAFVLWDGRMRRLIACRDRFGVKPLYYTVVEGVSIFASEIKSLLEYPGAFRGFSDENIRSYVGENVLDADDSTMFRGVYAVSPGTFLEIDERAVVHRRYWTLTLDDRFAGGEAEALAERYRALLEDAVRLRLRADVPIGTMLSSGLDSTSITALICEQRGTLAPVDAGGIGTAAPGFHHTFTACWPGWGGDEEAEVSAFCRNRGLQSHRLYITPEAMADVLPKVTYHLDGPFESPTQLVQYLLMRRARALGLKVVLNGHGSDEVLAGYPFFVPYYLAELLRDGRPVKFLRAFAGFRSSMNLSLRSVYERFAGGFPSQLAGLGAPARTVATNAGGGDSRRAAYYLRGDAVRFSTTPSLLLSELWRRFASRTLPMWLRMEDRVSMACSVESRLPFMDYRLVEMGFNLPDDLKLADGFTKAVLRRSMSGRLPDSIVLNRRKKRFGSPYGRWLRSQWRPIVEEHLAGQCELEDHVELADFRQRLRQFMSGDDRALSPNLLWRTLNAELFLRHPWGKEWAAQPLPL